jgi:hypothetical protein
VGEAEEGKIERHAKEKGWGQRGRQENRKKSTREKKVTKNSKHFRPELMKPTFLLHIFLVVTQIVAAVIVFHFTFAKYLLLNCRFCVR